MLDLEPFQFIMQYDKYQYDSVSLFDPVYAVASRIFTAIRSALAQSTPKRAAIASARRAGRVVAYSGPTPQKEV